MSKEINEGADLMLEVIDGATYCVDEDCPCPPTDRVLGVDTYASAPFTAREVMDAANAHAERYQFARG